MRDVTSNKKSICSSGDDDRCQCDRQMSVLREEVGLVKRSFSEDANVDKTPMQKMSNATGTRGGGAIWFGVARV